MFVKLTSVLLASLHCQVFTAYRLVGYYRSDNIIDLLKFTERKIQITQFKYNEPDIVQATQHVGLVDHLTIHNFHFLFKRSLVLY